MWAVLFCSFGLAASALLAQDRYTAADVDNGGRLYRTSCADCHGPDGDFVSGVDLGHGKFRRASSDDDLIRIITNGIPGTPMPPSNFTQPQAAAIVAYLRSMAASTSGAVKGDPALGRAIFEGKGGCLNCHRVNGQGSRVGPDLSNIGALRRAAEIEKSILEPDAEILPENRYVRAVTKNGATITGRILSEDTFTLQLIDSKENLISLSKADLREYAFLKHSPMPSYRDKLSAAEITSLTGYLTSLKGLKTQ